MSMLAAILAIVAVLVLTAIAIRALLLNDARRESIRADRLARHAAVLSAITERQIEVERAERAAATAACYARIEAMRADV